MNIDYDELYGEFMAAIQPHVFSYEHGAKAVDECCEIFRKYHETILSANDADPRDALLAQAREALENARGSLDLIRSAKERGFGVDYAKGCAMSALAAIDKHYGRTP